MNLLGPKDLGQSSIVANRTMNRERMLDSYSRELRFDVLSFLRERLSRSSEVVEWTDWCCGRGRALIDAASRLTDDERSRVRIEGVDLAGLFDPNRWPAIVTLREQALESWTAPRPRTLVTCVHGLHYVGDKLGAIALAVKALGAGGMFVAHLDLANVRHADGRPAVRSAAAWLRRSGITWDSRKSLVRRVGPCEVAAVPAYVGADDHAGPNVTGQPAVNSHYEF